MTRAHGALLPSVAELLVVFGCFLAVAVAVDRSQPFLVTCFVIL
uniref:Uncharacterized protein n=1 Tax=Arundo donax TaxID=35708 RepID=A0A0A9HSH9_ARUDO